MNETILMQIPRMLKAMEQDIDYRKVNEYLIQFKNMVGKDGNNMPSFFMATFQSLIALASTAIEAGSIIYTRDKQ